MQTLTYTIGSNRRSLVSDVQNFKINWSDEPNYNWVQARQYEKSMRQVFVNVKNEDGSPFDLTGANVWFEGLLPDGTHRVLDAKNGTVLEPTNGQFRFDFPAQAFSVAGSYKQAFFRIFRDGMSVTTLEFDLEVLADKVITGLVPTDYITPFEDLYSDLETILNNADGDLHAKLDEWTTEYTAKVQELTTLGTSVTNSLTSVQNRLSALETKIEEDGLFTQGEASELISQVNSVISDFQAATGSNDLEFDTGGQITPSELNAVNAFVQTLPADDFKILFVTDSHFENVREKESISNFMYLNGGRFGEKHLRLVDEIAKHVNVVVAGGDNINGLEHDKNHAFFNLTTFADRILNTNTNSDKFILLGNHDDGSTSIRYYNAHNAATSQAGSLPADKILTNAEIREAYQTEKLKYGETRSGGSLYFFKDYADKKIRLIGLDSFDIPDSERANYTRYLTVNYSENQLNWLANTALKTTPTDYQVVLVAHSPLPYGFDPSSETSWFNQDLLEGILNAFVSGNSFAAQSASGTPSVLQASVNVDFSTRGTGEIVGLFAGHVHIEQIRDLGKFNQVLLLNDVNTVGGNIGTDNEWAMTVICINPQTKAVTLKGFGRATNRNFNY